MKSQNTLEADGSPDQKQAKTIKNQPNQDTFKLGFGR